jgi:putative transposase
MPSRNIIKTYVDNSYYHIYNRGINKSTIFKDNHDYLLFLDFLRLYVSPSAFPQSNSQLNFHNVIHILAYCLLPNHFHLLIWQSDRTAMYYFMRAFTTRFVLHINKKYKRAGPLFQSRYKAVRITTDEQLLHTSRYIHQNPSPTNPTRSVLRKYEFSSLTYYQHPPTNTWLKTSHLLNYFNQAYPLEDFLDFTCEPESPSK